MTKELVNILMLCSLLLLGASCVVPPTGLEPVVIPADEFSFVSSVKRGKDYALGGRLLQAEEHFRAALRYSTEVSSVYNDLGFVLHGQSRFDEAIEVGRRVSAKRQNDLWAQLKLTPPDSPRPNDSSGNNPSLLA